MALSKAGWVYYRLRSVAGGVGSARPGDSPAAAGRPAALEFDGTTVWVGYADHVGNQHSTLKFRASTASWSYELQLCNSINVMYRPYNMVIFGLVYGSIRQ